MLVPGTKATVEDLERLRASGLADALARRAADGGPILGVCGGYQMLGTRLEDDVESGAGTVDGLGLLPVETTFAADKLLRHVHGTLDGAPVSGYEIRHGRPARRGGAALIDEGSPDGEGCASGAVLGTSWHGVLEGDAARRALLARVAELRGRDWVPGDEPFAAVRERHLDRLEDLVEEHADTDALLALIERGAPRDLPVLAPGATLCSSF